MRILVIGASGLVGSHVMAEGKARGYEVCGTYRNHPLRGLVPLDLANEVATRELLDSFVPDWVVHTAGWTWVDGCEGDPERAYRENTHQPVELAKLCARLKIKFAYLSTSYVFDGEAGDYVEEDLPNPINVYGNSKFLAEKGVLDVNPASIVARIICVWGQESQQKNFVYQSIKTILKGGVMKLPSDQLGNPTWAGDIARSLVRMMIEHKVGIWHVAADYRDSSRVGWFRKIYTATASLVQLPRTIEESYVSIPTASLKQPAKRPLKATLSCKKLNMQYGQLFRDASDSLIVEKILADIRTR